MSGTSSKSQRFVWSGDHPYRLNQPADGWIELVAPSDFDYVERFKKLVERVSATPLAKEDQENLLYVIDELSKNAIEWGNREDRRKLLRLACCVFSDKVIIKIEDEGEGFDPAKLGDPSIDPMSHILARLSQGKRVGGFGVHLAKKLMDEVLYSERGNVVLLTKHFPRGS